MKIPFSGERRIANPAQQRVEWNYAINAIRIQIITVRISAVFLENKSFIIIVVFNCPLKLI